MEGVLTKAELQRKMGAFPRMGATTTRSLLPDLFGATVEGVTIYEDT